MNYLSVCSGIEAATVAWHDLGWKPLGFSEIEKFPSEVLAHYYPNTPNLGDMTKYKEWDFGTNRLDLLVGGTPCQSFSVAGLRKGLDDPRGNLALTYVGILDKFRPKWCIWENVPGVLSSGGGRDFGAFLGALGELGYGWAYRVLDAQYFGVPQRRRRVFVVGCLGNWKSAAEVLFDPHSLSGNTKKGRKARERVTYPIADSVGTLCARDYKGVNSDDAAGGGGKLIMTEKVAPTLQTSCNDYSRADGFTMMVYENHPSDSRVKEMGDVCQTVTSSWGTGGGNVPFVQKAYSIREDATANNFSATALKVTPALQALRPSVQSHHAQTFIAQGFDAYNNSVTGNVSKTLDTGADYHHVPNVYSPTMAVRRLTPTECERLQGFPDNYTNIKENCPDGPRYKALGNSMAVPVMKWIGERIENV